MVGSPFQFDGCCKTCLYKALHPFHPTKSEEGALLYPMFSCTKKPHSRSVCLLGLLHGRSPAWRVCLPISFGLLYGFYLWLTCFCVKTNFQLHFSYVTLSLMPPTSNVLLIAVVVEMQLRWEHAACSHCYSGFMCRVLASDQFIRQHKAGYKVGREDFLLEFLNSVCEFHAICRSAYSSQGLQARRRQLHVLAHSRLWQSSALQAWAGRCRLVLTGARTASTCFPRAFWLDVSKTPFWRASLHLTGLYMEAMVSFSLLCSGFSFKLLLALCQK